MDLESENALLTSKLENAETTIQELTEENEILRGKIQEYENLAKKVTKKQERGESWSPFDE